MLSFLMSFAFLIIRNIYIYIYIIYIYNDFVVSSSVPADSCVFPLSLVTFTLLDIRDGKMLSNVTYLSNLFQRLYIGPILGDLP